MTHEDLKNSFKKETGTNWENSQKEPDIDYVAWLENRLISQSLQPVKTTDTDAVEFAEWLRKNYKISLLGKNLDYSKWRTPRKNEYFTTSELYAKFLSTKK